MKFTAERTRRNTRRKEETPTGFIEIQCHNCGARNVVYADQITPGAVHRCPHCLMTMDAHQWRKLVDAFYIMEEVNKGLRKVNDDRGQLFQAEYHTHYTPDDRIMMP